MLLSVDAIETAVRQLPSPDLVKFRKWFSQFDSQLWDQQIERDAHDGKLDALANEALAHYRITYTE